MERGRVVLTGATGFLGPHIVEALATRDLEVTALVRDAVRARKVLPRGVEIVACDLTEPPGEALSHSLEGASTLIHAAGGYQASLSPGADPALTTKLNIDASRALWALADSAGVDRFIALGSAAMLHSGGEPADESARVSALTHEVPYLRAKLGMRETLEALATDASMKLIEVMPGSLWGPGAAPGSAPFELITNFERQDIPGVLQGGAMIADVRDVASAIAQLVTHPDPKPRYILGGRRVEMSELMPALQAATGVQAPTRPIPNFVATLVSILRPAKLSPTALKMMRAGTRVDSRRAADSLGFECRPLATTIHDTVDSIHPTQHR